ncbi:MAG TPA: hypothetical protein PKD47_10045 [Solirubrobacterales bacterium]|nr:hypothetical protein [Solirubrobacterales bacterium]
MKVLSLCDLTGNFVQPWVDAGYEAILVDPQHVWSRQEGPVLKLARTVQESLPEIRDAFDDLVFVAAFPPCTDLAVSGARWFDSKGKADPLFQARAGMIAEQCRMIGELSGAPYLVENPVSVLASLFGPADHSFDPWEFTGLEPADNYRKKTCLWTGNGFRMPAPCPDLDLGEPDDRIHKAPPSEDRANFRSATPMGFARAVFEANQTRQDAISRPSKGDS